MTRTRPKHQPQDSGATSDEVGTALGSESEGEGGGRHIAAIRLLESAVEPLVEDLGYELLLLEWLGAGKRRLMRLYIDSPAGVTIEDCTRLGRILSNALDAREAAAAAEDSEQRDPVLAALLGKPYTLEISSPGVDRPLTRRRHFAEHVGGRVKIETWAPLAPGVNEKRFYGRIIAVEPDPAASNEDEAADQRRGILVVHDADGDRTLRIPLPRIRRANLVWEG